MGTQLPNPFPGLRPFRSDEDIGAIHVSQVPERGRPSAPRFPPPMILILILIPILIPTGCCFSAQSKIQNRESKMARHWAPSTFPRYKRVGGPVRSLLPFKVLKALRLHSGGRLCLLPFRLSLQSAIQNPESRICWAKKRGRESLFLGNN